MALLGKKSQAKAVQPDLPEFPWELDYLWGFFNELSYGLKSDGMGPVMASWQDVQAWSAAMQVDLEPWEKKVLVRLAWINAGIQSEKKPVGGQNQN
ncbi:hypothetical protein IVB03_27835 [Bradyrhizobium sp. 168]|uniref:phage tail assembly chaperone n=1 Tax=Bradyrhizobium sp. 168 TaxID=2782639 RepID=UPI001FF9A551|nr:hypothetical protein [Bradyrhizobium sp. 168]MCK1583271.1 hypothetical protein [Bradyrhizobium sp. 168]